MSKQGRSTNRAEARVGGQPTRQAARGRAALPGSVRPDRRLALVGAKHPALHRAAEVVAARDDPEVLRLAERMARTLAATQNPSGAALAAPQVGESLRLVVFASGAYAGQPGPLAGPAIYLNPQLTQLGFLSETAPETCLSLPGRSFDDCRATTATIVAWSVLDDEMVTLRVDGFSARVWQHEADHLDGKLVSDRWPESRR